MQQSNCIDLRTASGISSVVSDCLFQLLETELSLQVFDVKFLAFSSTQ